MNLQKFQTEFEALGPEYSWEVDSLYRVRATHAGAREKMCPIEAVYHSHTGKKPINHVVVNHIVGANFLGLNVLDMNRIISAADDKQKGRTERGLREWMVFKTSETS